MQHSEARCYFVPLLSCTCYSRSCLGNSAVALLFITLFELHGGFTFFLASVTNVLVKIGENNWFASFNAEAQRSSGSRSALDNCPKNTQLPGGQLYVKRKRSVSCVGCGPWCPSTYVCVVRPNKGSMQIVITSVSSSPSSLSQKSPALATRAREISHSHVFV